MLDAGPPVEFLILSSHDVMCLTNNIVSNTQTSTIEWYRIVFLTKKLKNTQQCSFRALAAGKIVELQNFWHQIQIPHPQISIKNDQACLYMKIWCFLKYVTRGVLQWAFFPPSTLTPKLPPSTDASKPSMVSDTVKPRFTGSLSNVFLDIQYILRIPCITLFFLC